MSASLFCKMWGLSSSVEIVEGRMGAKGPGTRSKQEEVEVVYFKVRLFCSPWDTEVKREQLQSG
jgi:hypothetical protein